MAFRIFFGFVFILFMAMGAKPVFADGCADKGGIDGELANAPYDSFAWECVEPEIKTVEVGNNIQIVASLPIPAHNGDRSVFYTTLDSCPVKFLNARNGTVTAPPSSLNANASSITGADKSASLDLVNLQDPFVGKLDSVCNRVRSDTGAIELERYSQSCFNEFSLYVGGSKTSCPFATRPYFPPNVKLTVPPAQDLGDTFLVFISPDVEAGRYFPDGGEWDFGDGTKISFSGSPGVVAHDYQKPISKATITLTVFDRSGGSGSGSAEVFFTEVTKPIAGFRSKTIGHRLEFTNTSEHPSNEDMTYFWDFGDSAFSTDLSPVHVYKEPGSYMVKLLVTDGDGDMDDAVETVNPIDGLFIDVGLASDVIAIDEETQAKVTIYNFETADIDSFTLDPQVNLERLAITSGPTPDVIRYIPKDGSFSTNYSLTGKGSGDTEFLALGAGSLISGGAVKAEKREPIYVLPELDIELSTSATSETRAGEDVTITLTITNNDNDTITGIRLEALSVGMSRLLTFVSGPVDPNGVNLRDNAISLAAGETTTITWVYTANERGTTNLRALLNADRVRGSGRMFLEDSTTLAIESAAFELSQLRIVGGTLQSPRVERPKPGTFNFIRGTITNVGGVDITDIDFELKSTDPLVVALGNLINRLDSNVSPEIAVLKPGKANSREFIIPISMVTDVSDKTRFVLPVEFTGKAKIDGEDVDVITRQELRGNIDRDKYHIDILPEVKSLLINGFISFIQGVDQAGGNTTLGGVAVGGTEGVLRALQKMGDGAFTAKDLVVSVGTFVSNTAADGGEALSEDALRIYNVIVEYNESTSLKQKAIDLGEGGETISNAGVRVIADWMNDVEKAGSRGDFREVAALLTESGTNIGTGVGAEKASATLLARILEKFPARKFLRGKEKKAKTLQEDTPQPEVVDFYRGQAKAWDDVPTGVPLTGNTVRMAGLSDDQYAYLIEKAKETGGTFIVRPRPETATKWALQRLNAKPVGIKLKSVNEIDSKWLGFDKADEGLIHMRKPDDPLEAMKAAVERGELEPGGAQIDKIIDRYNQRLAEFNTRDEYLDTLNSKKAQILDKDGNVISQGDGIVILREGKPVITKVSVDSDGFLIFDYNKKRVYSDIDLLSFGKADGSSLPRQLHEAVLKESSFGIDLQHGAPVQTSDFNDFQSAAKIADEQLYQHRPGGDGGGLIIIGPDQTTKGFVNSYEIASDVVDGSNYDLYGQVVKDFTLIGGNTR